MTLTSAVRADTWHATSQGDAARVALSISDKVAMEDGYILSGMRLGNGTQVWRFTPSVRHL